MADPELSFDTLDSLFHEVPERLLEETDKYVIFSDFHLGNGSQTDDFLTNAAMVTDALRDYEARGFTLILNGDIEELLKFNQTRIETAWPVIYEIFDRFNANGRLIKLVGNHDLALVEHPNHRYVVQEGIRLNYRGHILFIFHGHQIKPESTKHNNLLGFILKYLANPLRIKNYSLRNDSGRRFKVEKMIYHFSATRKIVSIIGHTHRPLFESMSKYDSLRFEIERLCRKFPKANSTKRDKIRAEVDYLRRELEELRLRANRRESKADYRASLYNESLVVPCLFNSGTVIGSRGMTCLELDQGRISLMHWFMEGQSLRHRGNPSGMVEDVPGTPWFRRVVKSDYLSNVFSRIDLLGGFSP